MNELNILRSGTAARKKLDVLQQRVFDLAAEIDVVRRASLALEDARRNLIREIEHAPDADGFGFTGAASPYRQHAGALPPVTWTGLSMVLFGGDAGKLADAIIKNIFPRHGYVPGLPEAEREAHIEKLRADLYKAEVAEETEVIALGRAGHLIIRRPDVDLKALLEVWSAIGASAESTAAVAA